MCYREKVKYWVVSLGSWGDFVDGFVGWCDFEYVLFFWVYWIYDWCFRVSCVGVSIGCFVVFGIYFGIDIVVIVG